MSVIDENWHARNSPACSEDIYKDTEPRGYIFVNLGGVCGQPGFEESEARARLAAQAPAMARLLLDLSSEHGDRQTFDWAYWHTEINAALEAAGVTPCKYPEVLPSQRRG